MIRQARLSDFSAIAALEGQVFRMHFNARPDMMKPREEPLERAKFEQSLENEAIRIFVYEEGGAVLGHCVTRKWRYENHPLIFDMVILEIDNLCVDEKARGRRIGQKLFDRARRYAKEIGAAHLELMVWEFNRDAKRFYESRGMAARIGRMELIIE